MRERSPVSARGSDRVRAVVSTAASIAVFLLAAGPGRTAPPTPPPKPEIEIKVATLAPEGTSFVDMFRAMDAEVRQKTANKVGFKLYPGATMGEEKTVISKIKLGQLHGGAFTGMGLGDVLPAIRVLEIPFLFESYEEADAASAAVNDEIHRMFEEAGWVELGRGEIGFIYLLSIHRIASAEDLRRSKVVVLSGDPLASLAMEIGRLNPVPLNVTDVLTSLATGVIDSVYVPPAYAIALQWNTRTKYLADYPFTNGLGGTIVTGRQFDKIPALLRPVVLEITRRHNEEITRRVRQEGEEAIEQMIKLGMKRVAPLEDQKRELSRISTELQARLPAALYPGDPKMQDRTHALIRKVLESVGDARVRRHATAAPPVERKAASPR